MTLKQQRMCLEYNFAPETIVGRIDRYVSALPQMRCNTAVAVSELSGLRESVTWRLLSIDHCIENIVQCNVQYCHQPVLSRHVGNV